MGESVTRIDQMIGQQLGPYRIEHLLGEGGMGIVYRAQHLALGQRVAIKVLRRNFANNEKVLQRFFNEARAVGIVQHPGLVRIHDYQQTEAGNAYIVMELLAGESLDSRMKVALDAGQGLPMATVLHLGLQMASALAAAHAAGVVHCDLKPENIFLAPDPEVVGGERIKILDFGIAKFLADSGGKATTVGLVLGTPRYMAPEQCEGRDHLTDKVDVYELGVILYEALAGRAPFVAQSSAGLMRQHMVMDPPLLRDQRPSLPVDMHDLVHEMLAKKPADRPKMAEVAERLQQLKTQPHQVVKVPVPAPKAPDRRRLTALVIGSIVFTLAGVGAGVVFAKLHRQDLARRADRGVARPTAGGASKALTIPPSTPDDVPGDLPATAHELAIPVVNESALKADLLRKHKLGKLGPKDGHLHPGAPGEGSGTADPASAPSASAAKSASGGSAGSGSPTAADAQSKKAQLHNRITNGDIEPDR